MARQHARQDRTRHGQPGLPLPVRRLGTGAAARRANSEPAGWEVGLAILPGAQVARNVVISDSQVRQLVAAAYALDDGFGLLIDTLAITGSRPSQAVRLRVEDLHDHPVRPKLQMPKSGKGGSKNRAQKRHEHFSLPITQQLAARLKAAANGRSGDAPLLTQSDGTPWPKHPGQHTHRLWDKIISAVGLSPEVTPYCLRHSSIVRMLLQGVPARLTAALHDTGITMLERTYSKHISEFADDHARAALLHHEPPVGENVVALGR